MDYIKLSSEEIADEFAAMSKKENDMWQNSKPLQKTDINVTFLE